MCYLYDVSYFEGIDYKYSNNKRVLDMNSISILRSRKDANDPCNEDLQNDDKAWMQHVVTLVLVVFWKLYLLEESLLKR